MGKLDKFGIKSAKSGDRETIVHGNLNAKSDQLELIPIGKELIQGLEPGGSFVGFQGAKLLGWKSTNLENSGGKLQLSESCEDVSSKPPTVSSIW